MSAANTDLVRKTAPRFSTALSASIGASDTTIPLSSVAGLPTDTAVTINIDETDNNGNLTPTAREVVTGVVSTSPVQLNNCLRGQDGTTAQSHSTGAKVVQWWDAVNINDFMKSYLTQHTQLGAHIALSNTGGLTNAGGITNTGGLTTDNLTATGTISLPADSIASAAVSIGPLVNTVASGTTITPISTQTNLYTVTDLAVAATIAAPSGTPVEGQGLTLRILDNGTSQNLTWNAIYEPIGVTLPTATVAGKLLYVSMRYNTEATKWDVLAIGRQ